MMAFVFYEEVLDNWLFEEDFTFSFRAIWAGCNPLKDKEVWFFHAVLKNVFLFWLLYTFTHFFNFNYSVCTFSFEFYMTNPSKIVLKIKIKLMISLRSRKKL
jgi:hypothetical protein